jgi:integrase
MKRMLKNVSIRKAEKNGQITWRLVGPGGFLIEPFTLFADSLLRDRSFNTRRAYCRNLALFIDYIYEAAFALKAKEPRLKFTRLVFEEMIEGYNEYLVRGSDAGNRIASLVHQTMPSPLPPNSAATSAAKHAPVREFLKLSERIRAQTAELVHHGLMDDVVDDEPLFSELGKRVTVPKSQQQAMLATSIIAGVVAGGPKLLKCTALRTSCPQIAYNPSRAFPYDQLARLISSLPTFRDRAEYALLAASGGRTHEILQMLFDDIDVSSGTVLLVDPVTRLGHNSYKYLSSAERESLAWKGRTLQQTFLIEPFSSMFFENLAEYMRYEYIPHGLHRFVFQYLTPKYAGRPFFLSSSDSRRDIFKKALSRALITVAVRGPHSIRHAYGTYLLNYFPRLDGGYGLPLAIVQKIMGHSNLKSTEKYAIYDDGLKEIELSFANSMVFGHGVTKSVLDMKRDVLNAQLSKLISKIENLH